MRGASAPPRPTLAEVPLAGRSSGVRHPQAISGNGPPKPAENDPAARVHPQILLRRQRKSPLHPTWEEGGFWIGTDRLSAYFAAAFLVAARFVAFFATEPVAAATFAAPFAMTFMTADWRAARRAAMFLPIFLAVLAIFPKTVLAGVFFAALLVAERFFAVFFLATFDPSVRPGCETGITLVHLRMRGYAICAHDRGETPAFPL